MSVAREHAGVTVAIGDDTQARVAVARSATPSGAACRRVTLWAVGGPVLLGQHVEIPERGSAFIDDDTSRTGLRCLLSRQYCRAHGEHDNVRIVET